RLPGARCPEGTAEPHRLGRRDAARDEAVDRPAVRQDGQRGHGVPRYAGRPGLQALLRVQVPGRTDGVEQPVPADHPGLVTSSEGVAPATAGVTRRRARPGKVLAPYLLSLPAGLWLLALFLVPLVVMLSLSL